MYLIIFFSLVQRSLEKQLILQVIPLHNKETLNRLRDLWVWPRTFFKPQPIGTDSFLILVHNFGFFTRL